MPHPEWALHYKQKGTELRLINGHYYLYEVSSKWNPDKQRAQKITGKCLGRVTPDGVKRRVPTKDAHSLQPLRVKEYGATAAIHALMAESLEKLHVMFPEWHRHLLVMAMMRLLYQSPLKSMPFHYEHSYLSELFQEFTLTDRSASQCLRAIGAQREQVIAYLKTFIKNEEHLILDVTHLLTKSELLSTAKCGYNSQRIFDPRGNCKLPLVISNPQADQPIV
jgi:hypothetical protein